MKRAVGRAYAKASLGIDARRNPDEVTYGNGTSEEPIASGELIEQRLSKTALDATACRVDRREQTRRDAISFEGASPESDERGRDAVQFGREFIGKHVQADPQDGGRRARIHLSLDENPSEFAIVDVDVIGPFDPGARLLENLIDRARHSNAAGKREPCEARRVKLRAPHDRDVKAGFGGRVPAMRAPPSPRGLRVREDDRAMRTPGASEGTSVVVGGSRGIEHGDRPESATELLELRGNSCRVEAAQTRPVSSSEMSAAGAEWVSAPTLMTSTPASQSAAIRASVTPPDASTMGPRGG